MGTSCRASPAAMRQICRDHAGLEDLKAPLLEVPAVVGECRCRRGRLFLNLGHDLFSQLHCGSLGLAREEKQLREQSRR